MYIYSGDDGGTSIAPDWSCYGTDAGVGSYARPLVDDAGGDDAAADASDAASPDAGTDAEATDAATPDAGSDAGESTGSDAGTYYLHLADFSTLQAPVGATVDLFWGQPFNSGAAVSGQSAAETYVGVPSSGLIPYHPPSGLLTLSYYVHPSNDAGTYDQEPVYWYNLEVVPPGVNAGTAGNGQLESNSVSASTAQALVTSVLGSQPPQANLATLVTAARDCQNRDVTGAQLKLIDGLTGQDVTAGVSGPAAPVGFYFLNNIPDTTCTYTNNSGGKAVWAILNAPVNAGPGVTPNADGGAPHPYILQMFGRTKDSDPAAGILISSTTVELYPGGDSVARVYKQGLPAAN
jgi:hypothetical protein